MKKRIFSFLMAVAMVVSILPLPALAAEGCANHPAHDASCGYVAAVEGQPCTHQHSDACRVETTVCTHVHTAECYPDGNMDGEPALCGHVCSEESGCVTVSCNHVHDGECGYVEAVAGQPCGHSCDLCNPPEEPEEKIVCICDTRCNEMVNTDCPVCAVDASQCTVPEVSNEIPQAVLAVQAMVDALPSLEEVQAMTDKGNAYNQTQAAYEAYLALTEEEKALVTGTEIFEVLFTYFNEQIMMLPAEVTYMNADGSTGTCDTYTSVTDQTTWNEGWYVVDSNRTISAPINVNGNVSLILVDGCTLNASKGVLVNGGSLTIYGQSSSSGTLVATASAAAIDTGTGTVTINSGNVNAEGGNPQAYQTGGAGIGTKAYTDAGGGTVIINGGTVTAKSNWGGAGIGSGGYTDQSGAKYGSVIITGGTVTAQGAKNAAGIGAGWYGGINSVSITGGTVTTTCGDYCSNDIGSGVAGPCPSITIGPDAVINNSSGNPANIGGAGSITYLATSVTLNQSEVSLTVGETATLAATVLPEKAAETNTVSWTTSDPVAATVSNGVVTAVAPGTATITATAGGKSAECTVTVMKVPVTGVALDKTSATIVIGSTLQLTATVSPENATNQRVTWGSNNMSIATVDPNGLVTAVSEGEASIIVTTVDGGKTASCKVTVLAPVTYLDANGNQQTCTDYTPVTEDMTSLGEDGKETWYVVDQDVTFPDRGQQNNLKIYGDVHLILKDGCTMKLPEAAYSGIAINGMGNNLTIYSQSFGASMGELFTHNEGGAADGNNGIAAFEGATLTINGGLVDAMGSRMGRPGIAVNMGTVIINGGIVKATGRGGTAAIGEEYVVYENSTIRITGGEVFVGNTGIAIGLYNKSGSGTYSEIYISGNATVTNPNNEFPGVSNATSRFIGVKSITLPSPLTLDIGSSEILTPTMFPAVATDISWTSDNESVATVDASGRVTAVSAGTANITVTGQVEKGGPVKTATCAVTVNKLDSNLPLTVNQNGVFTYGDTITVEFTPAVKAATRMAAPAIKEAALFLGTTQLTEAVTADASGKFTLTYNTADKGLSIGENLLTVQYGGSDKLNAGTADVTVTLNPKPVTVSGMTAVSRDYVPGNTTVTLDLNNATVVGKVGTDDVTVSGGTGTMADANVGENKAVTVTGLTLSGTHAGFYSLTAQPADVTVTITPKEVTTPTVTVTPDSYIYTGSPITPTSVVVKDGDTEIPDTEYTVAYANNTNVGTATVTIEDKNGGNYAVSGSGAFTITQSGTDMTLTTDKATYVYGDTITATVTVTPTRTAKLRTAPTANQVAIFNGTEQLTEPQTVTNGEALTFTFNSSALGAGNATLTAQYIECGNMAGQTATASVTVTPKPLAVTLTGTTTKVYDGTTACNGTGLTLTVEGVLDEDTVTHTAVYTYNDANVGDRTITANITLGGADAGNYALPEVALTAAGTITPKPVTLSWNATDLVYTGNPQAPTATAVGIVGTDVCTVAVTGAQTNAGTYTATATALSNGNYQLPEVTTTSFTINPKTINEVKLSETSFVYDGTEKKPTVTVMDGTTPVSETEYTVTFKLGETEVEAPTDAGEYTVVVTDNKGGNYAVSGSATFEIATSGTNGGVSLDHANNTYIYGEPVEVTVTVQPTGEAPSLLASFVNLLTGNDNTVSIYQGNTCLADPKEVVDGKAVFTLDSAKLGVGTWNLEARFSGSDNMAADTQPFQVIVNQKELTVTGVKTVERYYEPNSMTVDLNLNDAKLVGLVGEDEVTVSGGTGTISTDSAGTGKPVTVTGLTLGDKDAGNYILKQPEGLTVTIKQVTVTITANDATAKTGEEKPTAFGYSVDGLLGEDQLTTPPTFTCDADMTKAGTYDIVPSGAEVNSNYTLAYINGTLTVQQSTTEIIPGDTVRYIVEHYKGDTLADKEVLGGKIGDTVTAVDKNYEGYRVNTDKSTMSGTLVKLEKPEDIVILKVYYDLKVSGVSLNKTALTLTEGNTETLIATVTPEGAVNKVVTWSSSNTDVATVDANGKVTAVKEGKATITVTTADGGFKAECEVTVKPATYTVTFDSNGGSAVAAQTVENGRKATKPADPTLAKHNFKGWYTDEECTKPYDFGAPVTADLTLHAKWAEVYTFTLEYKANTSATVRSMPKDETVTSERDEMAFRLSYSKPKRSGYTFTGWNTQSNGKGKKYQPGDDVPGIKDGTVPLYAQWKQNSGSWWDNPKTGDYILIAVAVLAVSGIALAGLLVYAKKKKK